MDLKQNNLKSFFNVLSDEGDILNPCSPIHKATGLMVTGHSMAVGRRPWNQKMVCILLECFLVSIFLSISTVNSGFTFLISLVRSNKY